MAEEPGHVIAAGAREFIYDHGFGAEDCANGRVEIGAFAREPIIPIFALKIFDYVIGCGAAAVVAFVDHCALLAYLREKVAIEISEAGAGGVREIDVGEFAAAEFV